MATARRTRRLPALLVFIQLLPGSYFAGNTAADSNDPETVFASATLRIYRVVDGSGRPHLLLTNLDADGNRLSVEEECPEPTIQDDAIGPSSADERRLDGADSRVGPTGAPGEPAAETREIHVDAGEDNVVRVDDGNGTTIIININQTAPPEPTVVPVAAVPWVGWGSIAGPYRYPDEQPFLGYSPDIKSPSWFGGLGLNAGNGYGLSTGKPCGRGFDCMFPPTTPGP